MLSTIPIRSPLPQELGAFCQFVAARGVYPLSTFALMFEMMVGVDQNIREFRLMLIPRLKRMGAV